jgi:cyclopropane fatty-acyl-phospholipid synthase-like methyltransferase
MSAKKTPEELRRLHGPHYAEKLERTAHAARLTRLLSHMSLQPWHEVVDFACGNGALAEHVCPWVRSYTGIDFSESMIEFARARAARQALANARFEFASIETFCDSHQRSFDVGFALDFSEHVYDDDWRRILQSIKTSLRSPGKLYLHTPNAGFFLEQMKRHNVLVKQSPEHIAVRTLDDNTRLLEEAGFAISKAMFVPHYNALRCIHPLSFLPVLGRHFKARIFIEALS